MASTNSSKRPIYTSYTEVHIRTTQMLRIPLYYADATQSNITAILITEIFIICYEQELLFQFQIFVCNGLNIASGNTVESLAILVYI